MNFVDLELRPRFFLASQTCIGFEISFILSILESIEFLKEELIFDIGFCSHFCFRPSRLYQITRQLWPKRRRRPPRTQPDRSAAAGSEAATKRRPTRPPRRKTPHRRWEKRKQSILYFCFEKKKKMSWMWPFLAFQTLLLFYIDLSIDEYC